MEKHWEEGGAQLPFNIEALSPLACRKVQLLLWMCKKGDKGRERTEQLVCVYRVGKSSNPAFLLRRFIWPASVPVSWCWQNCLPQQLDSLSWLSGPRERRWGESCQPRRGNSQAHSLEPLRASSRLADLPTAIYSDNPRSTRLRLSTIWNPKCFRVVLISNNQRQCFSKLI